MLSDYLHNKYCVNGINAFRPLFILSPLELSLSRLGDRDVGFFLELFPNLFNPRLFSNLFPLGRGRHFSHPVELPSNFFLHQNFNLSGLRVSIADFEFEGPGFNSQ